MYLEYRKAGADPMEEPERHAPQTVAFPIANNYVKQGCADWGRGGVAHPILSNLQESWSKSSHAARELAIVFSVTFFSNNSWSIHQNAPPPPSRGCLGTSLVLRNFLHEKGYKKNQMPPKVQLWIHPLR